MSATRNDERYARFLELLPQNKYNVSKSALEAGFANSYATHNQKQLMRRALQFKLERANMVLETKGIKAVDLKRTMAEIVGFTREELMENVKYIATQEKDLGTRLKVVAPLVKEYGVDLSQEEKSTTIVPTLAITIRENGSTKAPNDTHATHVVQDILCDIEKEEADGGVGAHQTGGEEVSVAATSPKLPLSTS